jgi:hypothetical protein
VRGGRRAAPSCPWPASGSLSAERSRQVVSFRLPRSPPKILLHQGAQEGPPERPLQRTGLSSHRLTPSTRAHRRPMNHPRDALCTRNSRAGVQRGPSLFRAHSRGPMAPCIPRPGPGLSRAPALRVQAQGTHRSPPSVSYRSAGRGRSPSIHRSSKKSCSRRFMWPNRYAGVCCWGG